MPRSQTRDRGRRRESLSLRSPVELGELLHVLFAQARCDAAHRRVRALARLVGLERSDDVAGLLAGDLRHVVDVGERGLVAGNAVAADAHGVRVLESLALLGLFLFRFRLLRLRAGARGAECERGAGEDRDDETEHVCVLDYCRGVTRGILAISYAPGKGDPCEGSPQ